MEISSRYSMSHLVKSNITLTIIIISIDRDVKGGLPK